MFGIETLGGTERAVALVGIVLAEAILLYVGYGTLERLVGPVVTRILRGDCGVGQAISGNCPAQRPRGE